MEKTKVKLNLVEEEIYQLRKTVRYDIRDLTVEAISNKYEDSIDDTDGSVDKKRFNYIYIPEYQRDFTWKEDRQSKLIESIVLGLPIPFIFVAENKNSSWEIVDGSQRIRTLHAFINDMLTLEGLQSIKSLNGYKFSELDDSRQGKILNTALRIIVLSEETTEDVKRDMFERINRGSDLLKPMEKRKGIYIGHFNSFIYDYCKRNEEFKKLVLVDKWLVNRQEHEELLLRFFAISETGAYEKGINVGITNYLDNFLHKKNKELESLGEDELEEELKRYRKKIDDVVKYVGENFPYGFRARPNPQTKRAVFEAISVGVWLALSQNVAKEKLDKDDLIVKLTAKDFKKFTHVVNDFHKKTKLKGRINYIYTIIKQDGVSK